VSANLAAAGRDALDRYGSCWKSEFGTSLHIARPEGNEWLVSPEYNSVVAFDTPAGTTHYAEPIDAAAGPGQEGDS
jgi:hypothetical protein